MKKDKLIDNTLLIVISLATFFNLFLPSAEVQRILLTIFLLVYTISIIRLMKFKKIDNINKDKIIILIIGLSIIYILLLYLIGIYVGFYNNSNALSKTNFYNIIIPCIIIIICSEIIRQIFILKQNKKSTIIVTVALVLIEITIYLNMYSIDNLESMLGLIGYVGFSGISTNILCNYIVKRYGIIPNIIYRIITTIYIYVFGLLPDIYLFFQSVYKIMYPYIIYIIIDNFFEKRTFKRVSKNERISLISLLVSIIIVISIVMLISCKFKYGILVVGSSSMTGMIDKGDAVVFEKYDKQQLKKNQIIVFIKDNIKTIHSIENIEVKNDERIYYTKGVHNQQRDDGYRTDKDIIGVVKFKIVNIGWPTIWLNNSFNK